MSVIDQRVLVVAPSEVVWLYLTDPALISKWHRGAKQLSMLTTRSSGIGVRRRVVGTNGRALVEEMTAWLEGLGFEYSVIDGPYKAFKGRLRLQAVPEGTVVFWSIDYMLRGAFGGLRDRMGFRRGQRAQMADSLKTLRRLIEASGVRLDPVKQAKSAMQADPGFAARAARIQEQTRPVSVLPAAVIGDDDVPEMPPVEVTYDQTTSLPAYSTPPPTIASPALTLAGASQSDTKPRPPVGLRDKIKEATGEHRRVNVEGASEDTIAGPETRGLTAPTVPGSLVSPPRPPDPATETIAPLPPNKAANVEVPPLPADQFDTGEMSIWDVFGMERPSNRQKADLDAVIASVQTPPPRPLIPVELVPDSAPPPPISAPAVLPPVAAPVMRNMTRSKVHVAVRVLDVPRRSRAHVHVRSVTTKDGR